MKQLTFTKKYMILHVVQKSITGYNVRPIKNRFIK